MEMALRLWHPRLSFSPLTAAGKKQALRHFRCSLGNQATETLDTRKLVLEVKRKLEKEYPSLPVGKNGRDDEDMILWFLKDRKFSVDDAITKLTKAIKWREEFGVSNLSEESLKGIYETGKAYVHDFIDVNGRPVLVVVASKHFPEYDLKAKGPTLEIAYVCKGKAAYFNPSLAYIVRILVHEKQGTVEDQKLCVFLIEKGLHMLPDGSGEILVIVDLSGFRAENADVMFFKFLIDAFYYYYPRRLGQVLLVDAPFVFQPIWQLLKPLLKSYASLVRFCDAETARNEYFREGTIPASFKC